MRDLEEIYRRCDRRRRLSALCATGSMVVMLLTAVALALSLLPGAIAPGPVMVCFLATTLFMGICGLVNEQARKLQEEIVRKMEHRRFRKKVDTLQGTYTDCDVFWGKLFDWLAEHADELNSRFWRDNHHGGVELLHTTPGRGCSPSEGVNIFITYGQAEHGLVIIDGPSRDRLVVGREAVAGIEELHRLPIDGLRLLPEEMRSIDSVLQTRLRTTVPDAAISQARLASDDGERGLSQVSV